MASIIPSGTAYIVCDTECGQHVYTVTTTIVEIKEHRPQPLPLKERWAKRQKTASISTGMGRVEDVIHRWLPIHQAYKKRPEEKPGSYG